MKLPFPFLIIILLSQHLLAQSWQKTHRKAIVIDTHNDILMRGADMGALFDQDLTGKSHCKKCWCDTGKFQPRVH